ncbi:hypothetical protein D9M72_492350 [compost metagenome]
MERLRTVHIKSIRLEKGKYQTGYRNPKADRQLLHDDQHGIASAFGILIQIDKRDGIHGRHLYRGKKAVENHQQYVIP